MKKHKKQSLRNIHRISDDVFITASQVEKKLATRPMQLAYVNSMLSLNQDVAGCFKEGDGNLLLEHLATATDEVVEDARPVSIIMTTYKRDPFAGRRRLQF